MVLYQTEDSYTIIMFHSIVLSAFTVEPLFASRQAGNTQSNLTTDLGFSSISVELHPDCVLLPAGVNLSWDALQAVLDEPQSCFILRAGDLVKIQSYSDHTGRYYSLYPTRRAPTILVSGIPMHRIKDTDPHADTLVKIRTAQPAGKVLDTTTGLGYTAIEAARTAEHVITIELDAAVLGICRQNPWSQELFDNPRITQIIGDSFEVIQEYPDSTFSRIIHDPPTFSLAGDLYSGEFYSQAYRVLKANGRLFHYIGDLNSPSGHRVARGVAQRLKKAGFLRVVARQEAFAVLAFKN